jgi:16S rRNA (cytosine967-C5)-methyltransferase
MTPEARIAAAIDILEDILGGEAAERSLTSWGRGNRFAGSGDRAAIRDLVFDALRRRRSLGWLGGADTGRGLMLGRLRDAGEEPERVFTGARHAPPPPTEEEKASGRPLSEAPDPVRLDCPDWLWPQLSADLGDRTGEVLEALRSRAPVFLRANRLKGTRDEAVARLAADGIVAVPHAAGPFVIEVTDGARRVQASEAYRTGLVELQDASSQAVIDRLGPLAEGRDVLDYCAGGGGKALALAALGGRVTAHDADPGRMKDLPARAARAGARISIAARPSGSFGLVLCDAPCSGSGAWRRQPEAKWRLTADALAALTRTQDTILDAASGLVGPGGHLAYATCSFLSAENDARADAFTARIPGWRDVDRLRLLPGAGGDGFFLAVFRKS